MTRKAAQGKANKRPLYASVYEELVERIRSGQWVSGQRIPSELKIAADLRVSQGTARNAVARMAAENLVKRVQGLGTFVVEPTVEHFQLRFLNVFDAKGERMMPRSRSTRGVIGKPSRAEQRALGLSRNARVIRFRRLRMHGPKPFATESISLPASVFPGFADRKDPPDTLYDVFKRDYGVLVTRTEERITAAAADAKAASELTIEPDTPLLRIERIATALDGRAVEWRVSLYHLPRGHYRSITE